MERRSHHVLVGSCLGIGILPQAFAADGVDSHDVFYIQFDDLTNPLDFDQDRRRVGSTVMAGFPDLFSGGGIQRDQRALIIGAEVNDRVSCAPRSSFLEFQEIVFLQAIQPDFLFQREPGA